MDASSAQTTAAATPNSSATNPDAGAGVAHANVARDGLKCEWQGCGEQLPSAEQLYDHVCERHVGRKSTNNLNLTCAWGNCRTTTVKRDHITSHIRVHVPLKPHKCDFCQKAFKRPQDLKKHVKTHAEDPNYQASPEPARNHHPGGPGVFAGQPKHGDLQHLAVSAYGYSDSHHMPGGGASYGAYTNGGATNPSAYHPPANHYQANYMTTLYPVQSGLNSEYEVRKKATFDALNEFFGDIKNRQMDPNMYHMVGQRLMGLSGLPSYTGAPEYSGGTAVATASHPPSFNNHYQLPMPNLRTKNDLRDIDQFLEQLQATVYAHETDNQAASAGVHQPGSHYTHTGVAFRTNHSPPRPNIGSSSIILPPPTSTAMETPALTPASSVMSYNSPGSVHSATISPINRPTAMYPTLPSTSSAADVATATSSASLSSNFDNDGRRYPAGMLQKARNTSPDDTLPRIEKLGVNSPTLANVDPALTGKSGSSSPSIDPALRNNTETSTKSNEDPDWLLKVRVLESIRDIVKQRLENHEYDSEEDNASTPKAEMDTDNEVRSLYPVIRAVQEDN